MCLDRCHRCSLHLTTASGLAEKRTRLDRTRLLRRAFDGIPLLYDTPLRRKDGSIVGLYGTCTNHNHIYVLKSTGQPCMIMIEIGFKLTGYGDQEVTSDIMGILR